SFSLSCQSGVQTHTTTSTYIFVSGRQLAALLVKPKLDAIPDEAQDDARPFPKLQFQPLGMELEEI
ncbi:hypothetical protein D5R40_34775, partial [Okeania hirsuta]